MIIELFGKRNDGGTSFHSAVAYIASLRDQIDPDTGEVTAPEELRAIVNGRPVDPLRAWLYARPISLAEYDALTGVRDHHEFMAATHVAVDLGEVAPIRP